MRGLKIEVVKTTVSKTPVTASLEKELTRHESAYADAEKTEADWRSKFNEDYAPAIQRMNDHTAAIDKIKTEISSLPAELDTKSAYRLIKGADEYGLPAFTPVVQQIVVTSAMTGVDGKYEISNVPDGEYLLHAEFDTPSHFVDWLLPVTIKGNTVKLDLFNDNAETIQN